MNNGPVLEYYAGIETPSTPNYPLEQISTLHPHTDDRATIIFDLNGVVLGFEQLQQAPLGAVTYRPCSVVNPQEVLRLLHACKRQGHLLVVLSNAKKEAIAELMDDPQVKRVFAYFDDVILRSETGVMKDNPAAFEYVLEKHDLDPSRCIFIDDQALYLETARRAGIRRTILCKDFNLAAVRSELMRFGVL